MSVHEKWKDGREVADNHPLEDGVSFGLDETSRTLSHDQETIIDHDLDLVEREGLPTEGISSGAPGLEIPSLGYLDEALSFIAAERAKWTATRESVSLSSKSQTAIGRGRGRGRHEDRDLESKGKEVEVIKDNTQDVGNVTSKCINSHCMINELIHLLFVF